MTGAEESGGGRCLPVDTAVNSIGGKLREIFGYRELLQSLVAKNFKIRYHGSALGYLWSLLSPFLVMGLYTLVFSYFLRVQVEHYPLFLISTMVPWTFFTASLLQGTQALVSHSDFIKKLYCPRELFPLSVILTNSLVLVLGLVAVTPFIFYYRGGFGEAIVLLPLAIGIHFLFILGLALATSCLYVFYRDVAYVLDFFLMFWFYLTPIVYPLRMVPENLQFLFYINPMFHILTLYREILYAGVAPAVHFFAGSIFSAVLALVCGWKLFLRLEQLAAREL